MPLSSRSVREASAKGLRSRVTRPRELWGKPPGRCRGQCSAGLRGRPFGSLGGVPGPVGEWRARGDLAVSGST